MVKVACSASCGQAGTGHDRNPSRGWLKTYPDENQPGTRAPLECLAGNKARAHGSDSRRPGEGDGSSPLSCGTPPTTRWSTPSGSATSAATTSDTAGPGWPTPGSRSTTCARSPDTARSRPRTPEPGEAVGHAEESRGPQACAIADPCVVRSVVHAPATRDATTSAAGRTPWTRATASPTTTWATSTSSSATARR